MLLENEVDQEFCNRPVSSKEWFGDFSLKRLPLNHIGILTIALSHTQDHIKTQKKPSAPPTLQSTAFLVSWIHIYGMSVRKKYTCIIRQHYYTPIVFLLYITHPWLGKQITSKPSPPTEIFQ